MQLLLVILFYRMIIAINSIFVVTHIQGCLTSESRGSTIIILEFSFHFSFLNSTYIKIYQFYKHYQLNSDTALREGLLWPRMVHYKFPWGRGDCNFWPLKTHYLKFSGRDISLHRGVDVALWPLPRFNTIIHRTNLADFIYFIKKSHFILLNTLWIE